MENQKACRRCQKLLPLSDYYPHSRMADGHLNVCRSCVKARVMQHRELNLDRIREYDRNRPNARHRNDAKRAYTITYRSLHQERYHAHVAVTNAVRDGKLVKQPCIICNAANAEAHHHDYSKPLDVTWLCPVHHRRLHNDKFTLIPRIPTTF